MKIYHTETQADYDALMVELEARGCVWSFGRKLSESNNWHMSEHLTCIRVYDSEVDYASLNYYKEEYSHIPITKYKAKVNEMRFTKENVYKMVERYSVDQGYLLGDLKSDISKLDDTPEKVVVPKYVAEFYEGCENATIYYLIDQLARYEGNSKLGKWYKNCEGRHENGKANAQEVIAKMELYGYEVEKEPLYEVLLPRVRWNEERSELVTHYQKMMLDKNTGETRFVHRQYVPVNNDYTCKLAESDIKEIDERYWPFAVLAND